MKLTATNMFNNHQGSSESMRDYVARLNEATIKVVHPNQEMHILEFWNMLMARYFNESLAQRSAVFLDEVVM